MTMKLIVLQQSLYSKIQQNRTKILITAGFLNNIKIPVKQLYIENKNEKIINFTQTSSDKQLSRLGQLNISTYLDR